MALKKNPILLGIKLYSDGKGKREGRKGEVEGGLSPKNCAFFLRLPSGGASFGMEGRGRDQARKN